MNTISCFKLFHLLFFLLLQSYCRLCDSFHNKHKQLSASKIKSKLLYIQKQFHKLKKLAGLMEFMTYLHYTWIVLVLLADDKLFNFPALLLNLYVFCIN